MLLPYCLQVVHFDVKPWVWKYFLNFFLWYCADILNYNLNSLFSDLLYASLYL